MTKQYVFGEEEIKLFFRALSGLACNAKNNANLYNVDKALGRIAGNAEIGITDPQRGIDGIIGAYKAS